MFDFSKYNLQELQAMSDLLDYLREDAGADALSYFCGCSLLQEIKHESLRLSRSIFMSLEEQARDHAAAEAEKVNRIKDACIAGAPPSEEPDELRDLRALVDTLSRCSDRLAALALVEDRYFEETSEMVVFLRSTVLRNANRSVIDLLADIRDHFRKELGSNE